MKGRIKVDGLSALIHPAKIAGHQSIEGGGNLKVSLPTGRQALLLICNLHDN